MRNSDKISEFLAKAMSLVSQMRTFGEIVTNQIVVEKILHSLDLKFDHVVTGITESKDLSTFTLDELMDSLQAHEVPINRFVEKVKDEKRLFKS